MPRTKKTGAKRSGKTQRVAKARDRLTAILTPARIVTGVIQQKGDLVSLAVGGVVLEIRVSAHAPTTDREVRASRAATAKQFSSFVGQKVTVRAEQKADVLSNVKMIAPPADGLSGGKRFDKVTDVLERHRQELLALPHVLAVRPGYKFKNDWITQTPCIVVIVSQKFEKKALPASSRIPAQLEGVPTDVAPASPLTQYLAQSFRGTSSDTLANPLGLLLPGVSSSDDNSFSLTPEAAQSQYEPPPDAKLDPVNGPMSVLCHASPDAGWPTLKEFLDGTTKTLTVAMYNFTAPHIVQDLQGVFANNGALKMLLNPVESLSDGRGGRSKNPKAHDEHQVEVCKDLRETMSQRFDFTWAAVKNKNFTTGGLFPSAYHIKVAVRDSSSMWLSSGNWQSSNQPNLDPLHDPKVPPNLRTTYNREWHVVINGSELPDLYEKFIEWDFTQAQPFNIQPESLEKPELLVAESFATQVAVAQKFFDPLTINLTKDDQVVPLLTPDNYADHVIPLIQGAQTSIRFQNQYISIGKNNPPQFLALLDALKDRMTAGVDVKIILRNLGHVRDMVESLQTYGMDPDKYVKFIPTCHNKGIIVDDTLVCLGSQNWSGQGTTTNRDASLIFANADIAKYYAAIFDYDWSWATQVVTTESASPELAMGNVEPQGMVRIPWEAYFGDDERVDQVLAQASAGIQDPPDRIQSIQAGWSPLDISSPVQPSLFAAKASLSDRYLTCERAIAFSKNAEGISPVPEINVLGVGLGEMVSQNARTGITAVKLFVRRKYPKDSISPSNLLPTDIDGVPVDVEEIGLVRPLAAIPNPRIDLTPAQPGSSVGFKFATGAGRMAGTFGAVVRDAKGKLYVLSNNHVLADEGSLKAGAPIYQAGLLDVAPDLIPRQIARLTRFSNLHAANLKIDAAIAEAIAAGILSPQILYIGAPAGTEAAAVDMTVHKFGRTSMYTVGRVSSIATDIAIDYSSGSFTFKDQILIEGVDASPFSAPGDSGSLIVNRQTSKAIGLLFAGSASHTLANHIDEVLSGMEVTLV